MKPTISVIMPCLNSESHIQTALDSVFAQTFDDFELIVVDNGSTDRTPDILSAAHDPRVSVLTLAEPGVSRARNLALRQARGDFIAFLDSDDTWDAAFLQKMYTALVANRHAVLAYCGWQNLGLPGPRSEAFVPPDYETPDKMIAMLEGCRWPIHACLTRVAAIHDAGGFNTHLTIAEDYLLWMEVSTLGALVLVPEVLAQYHHHNGVQATHNHARAALDTLRAKQLFLHRHPEVVKQLKRETIQLLTWDKLIHQGNALHWKGDLKNARPVFRKALLAGYGSFSAKLRMLPSLLPLSVHRAILSIKERLDA